MFNPSLRTIRVRAGYSDEFAFGSGLVFCESWSGNLDAPSYMPQGSVRVHNTIKHCPQLSLANRDMLAGCADVGVCHDGAERADIREGFAK